MLIRFIGKEHPVPGDGIADWDHQGVQAERLIEAWLFIVGFCMSSANTSELGPSSVWPRLPLALGSIPTQRGRGPIELLLSKNTLRIHLRRVASMRAPPVVACWRVDPLFRNRQPRAQSSMLQTGINLWLRPPCVDAHATTHPTAALAPAPWRCSQTPRECPPPGPAPVLPPRGTQVVMGP